LLNRIEGRFSCSGCGTGFNDETKMPREDGICDVCKGNNFIRRKDDNRETASKRLEAYNKETLPLLPYYKDKEVLFSIDGLSNIENVTKEIMSLIQK